MLECQKLVDKRSFLDDIKKKLSELINTAQDYRTQYRIRHKNGQYIYVEDKERKKIATSKLEYLIDTVQYNGELQVASDTDKSNNISTITRFKNPCKELFFMLQDLNHKSG